MKIENNSRTIEYSEDTLFDRIAELEQDPYILRWAIVEASNQHLTVDITSTNSPVNKLISDVALYNSPENYFIAVHIVPTGIGCSIGGFAGDAAPATRLLAASVDYLITNPNSVNASNYIALDQNTIYTEGSIIDAWLSDRLDLYLPRKNRIGIVIERCDAKKKEKVINIINAVRSVHGIEIVAIEETESPIGLTSVRNQSGTFVGTLERPEILLDATARLIKQGASAIAVTSKVGGLDYLEYSQHFNGEIPNPIGGVEAILSHLIVRTFGIPCAHGPLMNEFVDSERSGVVDARSAGEAASWSGLACVLIGLQQAPQLRPKTELGIKSTLSSKFVSAVICPATSLGGAAILAAARRKIPIIAVKSNKTVLDVTSKQLNLSNVIEVESYLEAAGILTALRNGLALDSLKRPLFAFGR